MDPETAGHDRCQKRTSSPTAHQGQGTVVPHTVGLHNTVATTAKISIHFNLSLRYLQIKVEH